MKTAVIIVLFIIVLGVAYYAYSSKQASDAQLLKEQMAVKSVSPDTIANVNSLTAVNNNNNLANIANLQKLNAANKKINTQTNFLNGSLLNFLTGGLFGFAQIGAKNATVCKFNCKVLHPFSTSARNNCENNC